MLYYIETIEPQSLDSNFDPKTQVTLHLSWALEVVLQPADERDKSTNLKTSN